MSYHDHHAIQFERQVSKALQNVRLVLDSTRNPQLPRDVAHTYDNKYTLSETAVRSGLSGVLNAMELAAGLDAAKLALLKSWSAKKSVTIAFSG
jgi:hypothetical protein